MLLSAEQKIVVRIWN